MQLRRRRGLRALAVTLALLACVLVGLPPAHGDAVAQLNIVAVHHDPSGEIIASVRPPHPTSVVSQVSALVDGAPRPAEVVSRPATPASVVIAIDTSASMRGAPLASAQRAAMALVSRLAPTDRVAIVTFSDQPHLVAPFGTDRAQTDGALQGLAAGGNTALYDTVAMAAGLFAQQTSGPRVLVLLTDGQDFGSTLPNGRTASLDRIRASGAEVQSFALGTEADTSYLTEVANETHGGFSSVSNDTALNDLFTRLGERLGAPVQVAVQVPPLTRGTHTLEIRARVDGQPAVGSHDVTITNDGLLTGHVHTTGDANQAMEVLDITSPAPADTLTLHAQAAGLTLPVLGQPPRVLIDPWRFPAGPVEVNVTASVNQTVVSTASFAVEIPAQAPEISIDLHAGMAVAQARVQGAPSGLALVMMADGREIARGPLPELRVPVPSHGAQIEARIVDATGGVLGTASRPLPASLAAQTTSVPTTPWPSVVAAAMGALCVGIYGSRRWLRRPRRGRRRRHEWRPNAQTLLVGQRHHAAGSDQRTLATLVVRSPQGAERRYDIGRRPLSLGRSPRCDVVIDDQAVGDVHARLVALGGGEFQVHGIASERGLPCDARHPDEWLVVRLGEPIAIGGYTLTLRDAEASVA